MKRRVSILFLVLIYWGSINIAQTKLSENDSINLSNLADNIYSIQTTITCQGRFYDLNTKAELTTYTFFEFGTACRVNSHIITALHLIDQSDNLNKMLKTLFSQHSNLAVYYIDTILIRQSILSYWGASYNLFQTLICDWQDPGITADQIENLTAKTRVTRIDMPNKSFRVMARDERLGLVLLEAIPTLKQGGINFGQANDIAEEDLLAGLNAEPLPVPRSFNFTIEAGHLIDDGYGSSDLLLLSMNTSAHNSGDPILSITDNKLIGITVKQINPPNTTNKTGGNRLIVPAELIEKFYLENTNALHGK